ncbi:hypothetical protein KR215_010443, partial [Drosophila sulfurigaster]
MKTSLTERRPIAATHSHKIQNISKTITKSQSLPAKKIPALEKTCPNDSEGPLSSPHCEYTCAASNGAPT